MSSQLPIRHYLDIYQQRLRMMDRGITHPPPCVVESVRRFVNTLEQTDHSRLVELIIDGDLSYLKDVENGNVVARMEWNMKKPNEPSEGTR
jgi:hypothetical protein